MNGLEYAQKMVALWRSVRGNQTTHNWCQSFEGYYGQWAYQGNENGIQVYYNATAAANESSMFTTNVNDANIQPGDQLFWWYSSDGHVCTAVGRDDQGRVLVTNTANVGDVVVDLGNNVSITHADSLGLTFRGASRTNGANSARPGIVSWPVSETLAPNERRSQGSKARRSASSQSEKVDDGYLDPGTKWSFKGFVRGESVEGNNIWFVGQNSGLYYWSGTFDGGADTTGLAEIGAPPVGPKQRVVTGDGVYGRKGPGTAYEYQKDVAAGTTLTLQGWAEGDTISLNGFTTNVWYFDGSLYYSAACFTSQSTDGLTKLTAPKPTEPEVPEWKHRIPDSSLAKWIGSPNFNYRDPRPATEPPTHITLHWMDGTLAGTDAQFQKEDPGSSSTYGVGQTEIHQYVREIDYQQADGDQNSNRWGLSIEHEAGTNSPVSAAVKALSAKLLADIATRHGWTGYVLYSGDVEAFRKTPDADQLDFLKKSVAESPKTRLVFPHKAWASTSCPGTLPLSEIVDAANALLKKEEPPVVIPANPDDKPVTVGWLKQLFEAIVTAVRAFFGKSGG